MSPSSGYEVDSTRLRAQLEAILNTPEPRNFEHPEVMGSVAGYISDRFREHGARLWHQEFEAAGQRYKNVVGAYGPEDAPRIIVGAHYDVAGDQPGADDNASGVVGLLELARFLKDQELQYRIDLVAYALEEPPFFGTEDMGSYHHARHLKEHEVPVHGMISLEMLGYFRDEEGSQQYPAFFFRWFYGDRANFITVVRKFGSGAFPDAFYEQYKDSCEVPVKSFKGPRWVTGVDYSDHRNYWEFGFPALMITDTSFYRNPHYHDETDTIETLDLARMAKVIEGVAQVLERY